MAPGFKDMRANGNTERGGMGHAMVKSDTEILSPVQWLLFKNRC